MNLKSLKYNNRLETMMLNSFKKSKQGCACIFIPITKTIGVKCYHSHNNRNSSFSLQRKASKYGLGPKVGIKFEIKLKGSILLKCDDFSYWVDDYGYKYIYCYFTQIAKQPAKAKIKERKILRDKLDENKIGIGDFFYNTSNLGRIGKKLVVLDFDRGSQFCS